MNSIAVTSTQVQIVFTFEFCPFISIKYAFINAEDSRKLICIISLCKKFVAFAIYYGYNRERYMETRILQL